MVGFRPEIQALRALAVTLVVVFHLWPQALSGGYVGVDVFFVISGYLITAHLWSEVERTGTVSLTAFWSRRLRRLLPAASVVLGASLLLMLLVVPRSLWQQTVVEVGASALWAQNWVLSAGAVDYLAADGTPTLVQHYWSLSVEEQFYVVWPVLLVGLLALRSRRVVVRWVLLAVAVGSFTVSVLLASTSSGYFNTATRAWEFAAGGLLALSPGLLARFRERPRLARATAWVGIGMIGASAAVFTSTTPFPGSAAALPVLGTVLVIAGGADDARSLLGRVVRLAPVQRLGDISYSLYLWHWPLIIAVGYLPIGTAWHPVLVVPLALVLAALTKRFVEDPGRASRSTRRTYGFSLAAIATIVVLATSTWGVVYTDTVASARTTLERAEADPCFGAAALVEGCDAPFAVTASVDTAFAAQDRGVLAEPCSSRGTDVKECWFGDLDSYERTVAIVGNSHAAALVEGIDAYGKEHGWRVLLMRKTDCLGVSTLDLGGSGGADCATWTQNVRAELASRDDIDLVLFGSHSNALHYLSAAEPSTQELEALTTEISASYTSLLERGIRVLVVGDTPGTRPVPAPECVYLQRDAYDPCAEEPGGLEDDNIVATVGRATSGVEYLSLLPYVCSNDCHALIGGLVVYFDDHHLSGSFSRSLAPYLGAAIDGNQPGD
jgi:peptidoglycan/LPS O-acetylase OafA/YrhL